MFPNLALSSHLSRKERRIPVSALFHQSPVLIRSFSFFARREHSILRTMHGPRCSTIWSCSIRKKFPNWKNIHIYVYIECIYICIWYKMNRQVYLSSYTVHTLLASKRQYYVAYSLSDPIRVWMRSCESVEGISPGGERCWIFSCYYDLEDPVGFFYRC